MILLLFALAVGVRGEACDITSTEVVLSGAPGATVYCPPFALRVLRGVTTYQECDPPPPDLLRDWWERGMKAWTLTAVGRPGTLAVCHPKSAADFVPGAPVFTQSGYMALGALSNMRDPFVLVVGGMECIHLRDVRGLREAWDWRRGWHWAYYWDGRSFVSVGQMIPWRVRVKHRVGCWLIGAKP